MKKVYISVFFISLITLFSYDASAQKKDKNFEDWTVYTTKLQDKKTCYMASSPISKTGNYTRRDEPYFLVTRISNNVDEVSTSSGYPYKKNSEVNADIDGQKYKMYTEKELAWAHDTEQDESMIKRMKKGAIMRVKGTSRKGTYSIDKYSLKGFTNAYNRMKSLCNGNS